MGAPSKGGDLGVGDSLAGQAPFPCRFLVGRRRRVDLKFFGQPDVEIRQENGLVVAYIKDGASLTRMESPEDGVGGVVAMDLIHPALTAAGQGGGPFPNFFEIDRTFGAVDSGKSKDNALGLEDLSFGFQEDLTAFGCGLGGGILGDPFAGRLVIDRGGRGVDKGDAFSELKGVIQTDFMHVAVGFRLTS